LQPVDPGAFEERAAIIHDAHTITIADEGASLPEPIFTLTREEAETLAAQDQGHADADDFHTAVVARWVAEIDRLVKMRAVSPRWCHGVEIGAGIHRRGLGIAGRPAGLG